MDGTTKDSFHKTLLFRPSSRSYATTVFTGMIVAMSRKAVAVTVVASADGTHVVAVREHAGRSWDVRPDDYAKCLSVLDQAGPAPAFPSDRALYEGRVRNLLEVEFSDRSSY